MKKYLFVATLMFGVTAGNISDLTAEEPGKQLWTQMHMQKKLGKQVSCASCHTADLKQAGKHLRTGKRIEPMALSVNPERLADPAKVEKWFRRNCKWTWGRECTAQEKQQIMVMMKAS
jgi:mono/diheme cytochrome c family protein